MRYEIMRLFYQWRIECLTLQYNISREILYEEECHCTFANLLGENRQESVDSYVHTQCILFISQDSI